MSEMFDKKLVRRLAEVFDNRQETFDKGAWKDMEKRLNQEGKAGTNYSSIIMRAAAIILLLIILFVPVQQKFKEQGKVELSGGNIELNLPTGSMNQQEGVDKKISPSLYEIKQIPESTKETSREQEKLASTQSKSMPDRILEKSNSGVNVQERIRENQLSKLSPRFNGLPEKSAARNKIRKPYNFNFKTESEWPVATDQDLKRKNVSFSIFLSSLYNYTPQETKSQFNYSGGFQSDISITHNLKLNTGLIVAKQYFTTQAEQSNTAFHSSYLSESSEDFYVSGTDHFELIGLDLPLNITYHIRNLTFTAGLSSFFYIQERVLADFTSSLSENSEINLSNSPNIVKRNDELFYQEESSAFETLDLVNTFNFSLGYYFEWHENKFLIEPYIKHPIGDMTSYNIRYGSRGVRLIYVF